VPENGWLLKLLLSCSGYGFFCCWRVWISSRCLRRVLRTKKIRKAIKATTAMLPITIPAIGPPPSPLFEPAETAVVDADGSVEVEEGTSGELVVVEGVEVVILSCPPSLVVVLSRTDSV
jgi:hypothetical protein